MRSLVVLGDLGLKPSSQDGSCKLFGLVGPTAGLQLGKSGAIKVRPSLCPVRGVVGVPILKAGDSLFDGTVGIEGSPIVCETVRYLEWCWHHIRG